MKTAILAILVLLLAGCASVLQATTAFESSAKVGIRAANDQAVAVWSDAACAIPIGAVLRNPQIIPAIKSLCAGAEGSGVLELARLPGRE